MKARILTLWVMGLGIFIFTSEISAKTPVEELVERLPDNTIGFIATSGGDHLAEPFNQSILGQLWHDPGVQKFYQQIKNELKNKVGEEEDLSEFFNEIWPLAKVLLTRPCILGAASKENNEENSTPVYWFFILDAGEKKQEIDTILQKFTSTIYEEGIDKVKVGPYTMWTGKDEGPQEEYWGWVGNYLVSVINDPEGKALKYLVPSVKRPNYDKISALQEIKAHGDALVMHVDLPRMWQAFSPEIFEDEDDLNDAESVLSILGLDTLQTMTARFGFNGRNLVLDALVKVPQPYSGLVASLQPVRLDMLDCVDRQAVWTTVENINLGKIYDSIMAAIENTISPEDWQEVQDAIRKSETKIGFSIRQELLNSIAGPIVSYSFPAGASMEIPSGGIALLVELKDSTKMNICLNQVETLVNKLNEQEGLAQGMMQTNKIERDGKIIHVWTIPFLAIMQISPAWVITDNQLIIATNPALIQQATKLMQDPARKQKSVRSTVSFQRVTKNLPQTMLTFGYTNSPVQFKQMLMLIQQFWPLVTMAAKNENITLPAMLPMMDHLIEKMGPSYDVCWSDEAGIHFHSQGPIPSAGSSLVGGTAVMVSIMLPAMSRARELAKRVQCTNQLRGIGNAIAMYNNDFEDKNPKTFQELIEFEDLAPKWLICPSSDDEIGQCSYIYRGADLTGLVDSQMVVAYDKYDNHDGEARNVLFAGGHVERYDEEGFQKLIRKDNELRRKMGLPEKPADIEPAKPKKKRSQTFE
jgi:prepilin-type processing-associated H-X9-DG protein